MSKFIKSQHSFTAGELSPRLAGRSDVAQYANGCDTLLNAKVTPHGGVYRRGGSRFIAAVKDQSAVTRLIRFEFSTTQAYVLEFGNQYIRFYKDGGAILETAKNITAITQANPAVVTSNAHGFSNGNVVVIDNVVGMTQVNDRRFTVAGATANTFQLSGVNSTGYTAYSSGGTASRVYEITTVYTTAQLPDIQVVQSADTMYLAHPNVTPYKLTRTGHTAWTIAAIPFLESTSRDITGVTRANPAVVTVVAHGYANGDAVWLSNVGGMTQVSDLGFTIANKTADTFQLVGIDSTAYSAYTSGGTSRLNTKPTQWTGTNFPGAVAFFEQRLYWAGTPNEPQTIWASKSGDYEDLYVGTDDDDAFKYTIATDQVNAIMWLSPGDVMLIGTAGGEFVMSASSNGEAIAPTNVRIVRHSTFGSKRVQPARVAGKALFVQRGGTKVRGMGFVFEADAFQAPDLSILADHIGRYGLSQLALQQVPDTIVWGVRGDGVLVGLTYDQEQQVIGWHRHIFGGVADAAGTAASVESVVVIPGNSTTSEDELWVITKRRVNGSTVRYVEQILDGMPWSAGVEDAFFVDSGLTLDTPIAITAATKANPVVVTAASHGFSNGDTVKIRDVVGMTQLNNYTFKTANVAANTFELQTTASVNVDGTAYGTYVSGGTVREAVTSVSGLDHLEGQTVAILADGAVRPQQVVASGVITLSPAATIVHVGLPYSTVVRTMSIEGGSRLGASEGSIRRISHVIVRVDRTVGLKVGTDSDTLDTVIFRTASTPLGQPAPLFTGLKLVEFPQGHETEAKVQIQQDDPLPFAVLSLTARLQVNEDV